MTLYDTSRRKQTLCLVIQYSFLFLILTAGIFAIFIAGHLSFISYGDPHKQGYFWTVELQNNLKSLLAGEGFPHWSWYKGLGMEVSFPTDPFAWIAALFPPGYIELGYTVAAVLRMYCSGLLFLAFGRETGLPGFSVLLGSLSYGFSGWAINMSLAQASFVDATVMLPLLMLGVDRVYKGKSPLLFIFAVAYALINNPYLAYMCAIAVVVYLLLRYFAYCEKFHFVDYLKKVGLFIVYGLTGILISTVTLVFYVEMLRSASLDSANEGLSLFQNAKYYYLMGVKLMGDGMMDGYSYAGISVFLLCVLGISLRRISLRNTGILMTLLLLVFTISPYFGSMFNGFSYPSGRWYFLLTFFPIWAACESLDLRRLRTGGNIIILLLCWALLAFSSVGLEVLDVISVGLRAQVFMINSLACGFAMIVVVALKEGGWLTVHKKQIAMVLILCAGMILSWNLAFYDNLGIYLRNNQENKQLASCPQRAGAMLEDDGFYRVDQVDGINMHAVMAMQANETLWWQTRSIYLYDSKLPSRWLRYNQLVGNNYGYSKRVYVQSNQNRMGLDFLYGVKYFLGDDTKNGITGSSNFAGYGFSRMDTLDGVEVYQNKYDPGLGFAYEKYIPESEFLKLSRLEREQALLQAAVVPDDQCDGLDDTMAVTCADIKTDIQEVPFRIVWKNGIKVKDNQLIVKKKYANMTLKVDDVTDSQLMVSFDNLIRHKGDSDEPKKFALYVSNDAVAGNMLNDVDNNQTIPDIRDYDFNLGYYDAYDGKIRLKFSRAGTYTFDKMYVSAMRADRYDKDASRLEARKYNISYYDDKTVQGSVDLKTPGIMYFSIPKYDHWDVYIDGEKVQRITDLNISFLGAQVPAGHHEITLRYDFSGLKRTLMISLAGVVIAIVIGLVHFAVSRRRKERHEPISTQAKESI